MTLNLQTKAFNVEYTTFKHLNAVHKHTNI